MPLRFDEATKSFTVSVRELAEGDGGRRGGFERGETWNRLGLGAELHTTVLEKRCRADAAYQREIHLETKISLGEWTAVVTGRLDGCIQRDGGWLIEEFKSAYSPDTQIRPFGLSFERHRRQLLIYCHLWRQRGHTPVSGALVYVDIATEKEFAFEISYNECAQQQEIESRLRQILAIWKSEEVTRKGKANLAHNLPFPHQAPRPGQTILIDAVREAVRSGGNLFAEAPTGSGKTASGLHPALAESLTSGKQLFFLTAKTSQQKMAADALVAMNREGGFRTLQMRSKEKMCANDRVICHEDFCPYAKNYPEKMDKSNLLERLRDSQTHHDPNAVFEEAKREKVCPFEVQLELAARADVVIADYNYVFDPGVALRQTDELENIILLVDEAHNLPDRARQIFSPELHQSDFRSALSYAEQHAERKVCVAKFPARKNKMDSDQIILSLGESAGQPTEQYLFAEICDTLSAGLTVLEKAAEVLSFEQPIAETVPPMQPLQKLWKEWEGKFIEYLSWKREHKIAAIEDPIVEIHFALQRFLLTLHQFGPGFTCVVEQTAAGIRLAVVCLDPARPLAPIFGSAAATVFLSATLSPVETTRRVLGLEVARTKSISLPPPFPRENRKIIILPQVRTTFGEREKNFPRVAKLVAEMSDAVPGNVLVLFPSYTFLAKVAERMPLTAARLLKQRPNVPELERQEILRALSNPKEEKILLFAVLGGMYAEGVDYPGELLSAVFVVSPALPQVSFERELLRRYFDEQEQAGFDYAYLQPGMTRVIQAAGRLIRSESDRGVIALICQRFVQMPYSDYLPKDWFDETPAELIAQNPVEEIENFF